MFGQMKEAAGGYNFISTLYVVCTHKPINSSIHNKVI